MTQDALDAPHVPGRWPVLGHMVQFGRDSLGFLRGAQQRYGPVFWCDHGFGQNVLMILGEEGLNLFRDKRVDSSHFAELEVFMGGSMLTVDGPEHRRMRGASSHAFTPAGLSRAKVGELIADTVARRVDAWRGQAEVPVVLDTRVIALELIFRVMGVDVSDLPEWERWYGEYMVSAINIPLEFPGTPRWRGRRARRWLEERLGTIIADARARDDRESMVGAMVHGRDEGGARMSDRELIDNLMVLGFAGHETTASTMAWSMFHLAASPTHWDRLCAEATALDEVPRDFAVLAEHAPMAVGVFRESLRLYPPVAQDTRMVNAELEVAGYRVPPKTLVGTSLLLLSRSPKHYERPDEWQPERWAGKERRPSPVENCQFGGGAHFCLGYHMALLEGTMFLVQAARALSEWGVRPQLMGDIPKPSYLPLIHPPRKTKLGLIPS